MPNNIDEDKKMITNPTDMSQTKDEIEEQYRILKDEEEKEEKRKIFLLLALFFLIFAISFAGTTFSYLSYKKSIDNKNSDNILESGDKEQDYKDLTIVFNAGTEFIAEDVEPGWESTTSKDFSITNASSVNAQYNIEFIDIQNEFTNIEALRYSIKCNGEYILTDQLVPLQNKVVLRNQEVKARSTNNYEIYFKYIETNTDQTYDSGKTYKLSVNVSTNNN